METKRNQSEQSVTVRGAKPRRHHIPGPDRLRWVIVFLAIAAVISGLFAFFEMRAYYQRRENHLYLAENQIRLMDSSLSETMSRVYMLRLLVKSNDGDTAFFDELAEELYEETVEDTGLKVRNFILAPDGIVEKVYPLEGNESMIGFDYMDETQAGNAEAIEAYKENKLILTAPFNLKQGGVGIAARIPVYLDSEDGQKFWGLVSVTLDMEYLLDQFNLEYLEESGINYCLSYESYGETRSVLKDSGDTLADPVSVTVVTNNLTWILEVEPESGWQPPLEIAVGFLVILVISFLLTRLLASRSRIREMNAVLGQIALRDNLTGCYSRHFVNVMLLKPGTREWKDDNACYSLAVIDVDNFKQINDTFGHDVGDQALCAVAELLKGLCDELRGDCVIRYGGDEFIFLMNDVHRELFEERLEALLTGVREIRLTGASDVRLTVSVGAVMGCHKDTYYELFSRADKQIYISKEKGKDQYHLEPAEEDGSEETADGGK